MKSIAFLLGTAACLALPTGAQGLPLDGPALGNNRITQADITGGALTVRDIRRKGLEIFATPFNKFDGMGDGPVNIADPVSPGGRPTLNGSFLMINGLESQACNDCHSILSSRTIPGSFTVGGAGGIIQTATPGVTTMDLADINQNGIAEVNGRVINPPFVFGSGGVELLAKEMTADLQDIKAQALATPNTVFQLDTKGVNFGSISHDGSGFDESQIVGIDTSLVVAPFGRKGNNSSVRAFDIGAIQFHQGMQPQEVVGNGVDADGDGVVDEILVGELSALHIFESSSDRPIQVANANPLVQQGAQLFETTGCNQCHRSALNTESTTLGLTFPEVATDPTQNIYFNVDLLNGRAGFESNGQGGLVVELFSDLKRHHMGTALSETTGDPLDPFFITPRLWGVADTAPYLHDGRAFTLRAAIEAHAGEAVTAAGNFDALTAQQQDCILIFLNSLRVPRSPNRDIIRRHSTSSFTAQLGGL